VPDEQNTPHHFVITGASRGIGRSIALAAAATFNGVRISLLSRSRDTLKEVAAECADLGAETAVIPCDVTDAHSVVSACDAALKTFGAPTVLVNNAGTYISGGVTDTSFEDFDEQIRINLTSGFMVSSRLIPSMIDRGSGHVIYISSIAALKGYPDGLAYCAAKHGTLGLARAVREELKPKGIGVTALMPGATFTSTWDGADISEDRIMPPEDIANAVMACVQMAPQTVVEELVIRPQLGDL